MDNSMVDPQVAMYDVFYECIYRRENLDGVIKFVKANLQHINYEIYVSKYDCSGTLLHWACYKNRKQIVQFLLSQPEIDENITFKDMGFCKSKAVDIAKERKHYGVVKLFQEKEQLAKSNK
eukprot:TRINITY_DN6314_c0_g1_i2.p1 TRINITY_DN6314_c0_g1~~TRINITY_DN6314_c0_g1_i2.p1  ORF type:complete len:135 (+),score=29.62 TRINITY_DN6314_c0_g1_i2:45-407(+)